MTWYYALGNERQGPVDDAVLDSLIATGVVTPDTLVWKAGMPDWQPLAQARPRLAPPAPIVPPPPAAITPTPVAPTPAATPSAGGWTGAAGTAGAAGAAGGYVPPGGGPAGWSQPGAESADQLLARVVNEHRTFGIGDVVGRGWELVSGNLGLAIGAAAIWLLCSAAGAIPCLGILIGLGVTPIVQAGIYRLFLKLHRGEPAEFGDVFSTFSTSYLPLLLYTVVQAVLIGISVIPGYAVFIVGNIMAQRSEAASLLFSFVAMLLILPPAIYLAVSWVFAPLLIIDKGLDFWPAMELSRKTAGRNFFGVFALVFICGLIFLAGIVALCLGVLVTAPLALAAIAIAYDSLYGRE